MAEIYEQDGRRFLFEGDVPLGELLRAPDGADIVIDAHGQVLAAADPGTGQALDPAGYEYDNTGEQLGQAEQILGRLEEMQQQERSYAEQHAISDAAQRQAADEQRSEAAQRDVEQQGQLLMQRLGRNLTTKEAVALAQFVETDVGAGRNVDLNSAYERARQLGEAHPARGELGHSGRVALGVEHFREQRNEERYGDPLAEPRRAHQYDVNSHEGRVAAAMDQVNGHDVEAERLYRSVEDAALE